MLAGVLVLGNETGGCLVEVKFPTRIATRLATPARKMRATPDKARSLTRGSLIHGALLLLHRNRINPKNALEQSTPKATPKRRRRLGVEAA